MDDFLDELTLGNLDGDQYDLAECIGLEAYVKLVRTFAGSHLNVPMSKSITTEIRNRKINEEFDGDNQKKLAKKYGLSEMSIYRITADKLQEIKEKPIDGQLKMF